MLKGMSEKPYRDRDRDRIREQWPTLGLREKGRYIWFYYRVYIIVGLILAGFAIFLIRDIQTKKADEAFYVMVLDHGMDADRVTALQGRLSEALGLETDTQTCVIETAYSGSGNAESAATVSTYMQSGRVDLLIAPEEKFNVYASTGYLAALPQDVYEMARTEFGEERLFYASQVDYSQGGAVTDIPLKPHEQTADSECYGIYLEDGEFGGMVLGILVNGTHGELVSEGLQFFLQETTAR